MLSEGVWPTVAGDSLKSFGLEGLRVGVQGFGLRR